MSESLQLDFATDDTEAGRRRLQMGADDPTALAVELRRRSVGPLGNALVPRHRLHRRLSSQKPVTDWQAPMWGTPEFVDLTGNCTGPESASGAHSVGVVLGRNVDRRHLKAPGIMASLTPAGRSADLYRLVVPWGDRAVVDRALECAG